MPLNDAALPDTTPSASRPRSYSGGYMDAGKVGEAIFLKFLRADPDTACVLDVRSDKHWQDCDVDFRVRRGTGEWWSVEGKYDRHLDKTGNVLFELFRVNHTAPQQRLYVVGWSVRSAAEHLLFYAPSTHTIHSIRMLQYRLACANAVRQGKCRCDLVPTDEKKTTINAYFPQKFVQEMSSYQVYDADSFALIDRSAVTAAEAIRNGNAAEWVMGKP
jgi:hypothetical protein